MVIITFTDGHSIETNEVITIIDGDVHWDKQACSLMYISSIALKKENF